MNDTEPMRCPDCEADPSGPCNRIRGATPDDVTRSRQAAVDRRLQEREELAALIHRACGCDGTCPPDEEDGRIADALLAAGWRASTKSCPPTEHVMYTSCGVCGDVPEEIES